MTYTFGVFQSSGTACIYYKIDGKGNQSTFNVFVSPEKDAADKKEIIAIVDNDQIKKESLIGRKGLTVGDVFGIYGTWASGCSHKFDLEAKKNLGNLFRSELRTVEVTKKMKVVGKADVKVMKTEASYEKEKKLK